MVQLVRGIDEARFTSVVSFVMLMRVGFGVFRGVMNRVLLVVHRLDVVLIIVPVVHFVVSIVVYTVVDSTMMVRGCI